MSEVLLESQALRAHFYERLDDLMGDEQHDWLLALRKAQLDLFFAHGFPTAQDVSWRWTDVSPLTQTKFHLAGQVDDKVLRSEITPQRLAAGQYHLLVFINGYYSEALSDVHGVQQGVVITTLAKAIHSHTERIRPYLEGNAYAERTHPFACLNTALMTDGVFIYVPPGKTMRLPVHALMISTGQGNHIMSHIRHLVIADEAAGTIFVEDYLGLHSRQYLRNAVTQVHAAPDARVDLFKYQRESAAAFHMSNTQIRQQSGSRVRTGRYQFGGRVARDDVHVSLNEADAEASVQGLYLVNDGQHLDHQVLINHNAPNCQSQQQMKGVFLGQGSGVFSGGIKVAKRAAKTSAAQKNDSLMCHPQAKAYTEPTLEIYADDVQCSHGATVGQVDEQMLYYMRARGLSEATALYLLSYGFAKAVIDAVEEPKVKARLMQLVKAKLPKNAQVSLIEAVDAQTEASGLPEPRSGRE